MQNDAKNNQKVHGSIKWHLRKGRAASERKKASREAEHPTRGAERPDARRLAPRLGCAGDAQGHAWGRRDAGRAVGAPEGRGEPRGAPREVGPSGGTGTSPEGSRPRLTRRSPRLGCAGDAQGHAGGRGSAGRAVRAPEGARRCPRGREEAHRAGSALQRKASRPRLTRWGPRRGCAAGDWRRCPIRCLPGRAVARLRDHPTAGTPRSRGAAPGGCEDHNGGVRPHRRPDRSRGDTGRPWRTVEPEPSTRSSVARPRGARSCMPACAGGAEKEVKRRGRGRWAWACAVGATHHAPEEASAWWAAPAGRPGAARAAVEPVPRDKGARPIELTPTCAGGPERSSDSDRGSHEGHERRVQTSWLHEPPPTYGR